LRNMARGKLTIPLAATIFILVSGVTAYGAFVSYKERMAQMDQAEIETDYIWGVQGNTMQLIRHLRETEQERYDQLTLEYETAGRYPEGSVIYLEKAEDYTGKGIALLASRSTYMLPEEDLTDEELLELIDLQHKFDYSLDEMVGQVASGEREDYPDWQPQAPEADGDRIVAYEGDLEVGDISLGKDCFYLAGTDRIDRMRIGSGASELFATYDFGGMSVHEMAEDMDGGLYVLLEQRILEGEDILHRGKLLHLDRDGNVVFAQAPEWLPGGNIAVDQNGNLYVVVHDMVYILDGQGQEVRRIQLPDRYSMGNQHELCRGKDGAVYLATMEKRPNIYDPAELEEYLKTHPTNTILIRFDPDSPDGYEEVAQYVIPEQVLKLGDMVSGAKTDFVFWSFEGVYTYSLGDAQAVRIMQMYEAPLQLEGAQFFVLPDGRLVFAKAFADEAVDADKLDWRSVPETLRFFYITPAE
ncbi:MAG: hypothetical protein IJ794_00775, partial [Lachnospiraceae bacterium]|nr:hypothetical protein [Lachnospiraceae bacterium]